MTLERAEYENRLYGFWLGQCIANWTGLVTEMDKIGDIGEFRTGAFYTRDDWGQPDEPSIWGEGVPSDLSPTIDFVFRDSGQVWGADDDTDIEYIYQRLTAAAPSVVLTPEEIRDGWLRHIREEEENYLWVANQRAYDLMRDGVLPPATGDPARNEHYDMIDAQLTTEIFGLYAPGRPDIALRMADLPIRTVAREEAEEVARFYVVMHALAAMPDLGEDYRTRTVAMATAAAAQTLTPGRYPAAMYAYVHRLHAAGLSWEATRDSVYQRYQVDERDGYTVTSRGLYCNGCFAAGINFAASLVSLFYGEGDLVETIKIGTLCGWDSDNPTATWGGLLGFMYGREGVEAAFGRTFASRFHIHRTRRGFEGDGVDAFERMAEEGAGIVERVVREEMGGEVGEGRWGIPMLE